MFSTAVVAAVLVLAVVACSPDWLLAIWAFPFFLLRKILVFATFVVVVFAAVGFFVFLLVCFRVGGLISSCVNFEELGPFAVLMLGSPELGMRADASVGDTISSDTIWVAIEMGSTSISSGNGYPISI